MKRKRQTRRAAPTNKDLAVTDLAVLPSMTHATHPTLMRMLFAHWQVRMRFNSLTNLYEAHAFSVVSGDETDICSGGCPLEAIEKLNTFCEKNRIR